MKIQEENGVLYVRGNRKGYVYMHFVPHAQGATTVTCSNPPKKRTPHPRRPGLWARLQAWWNINIEAKP